MLLENDNTVMSHTSEECGCVFQLCAVRPLSSLFWRRLGNGLTAQFSLSSSAHYCWDQILSWSLCSEQRLQLKFVL